MSKTDSELVLDEENQPCLKCGGDTDTSWECIDCGYDNRDWYYPEHLKKGSA
jgi:hypothetical protein